MANYDSSHTGSQIDAGVDIALSFANTPTDIDNAVNKISAVNSTPSEIDDSVDYTNTLEGAGVDPASIAGALGFIGRFTNTPENIDAVVDDFENVASTASQIDRTVDTVLNNSATAGEVLTADGLGGSSFQPLPSSIHLYHHRVTLQKLGEYTQTLLFEWIDNSNNTSINLTVALMYIFSYVRNANNPHIVSGSVNDGEGGEGWANGIYYDTSTQKYVVLCYDSIGAASFAYSENDFASWDFYQSTRQII